MKIDHLRTPQCLDDWQWKKEMNTHWRGFGGVMLPRNITWEYKRGKKMARCSFFLLLLFLSGWKRKLDWETNKEMLWEKEIVWVDARTWILLLLWDKISLCGIVFIGEQECKKPYLCKCTFTFVLDFCDQTPDFRFVPPLGIWDGFSFYILWAYTCSLLRGPQITERNTINVMAAASQFIWME